MAFDVGYRKKLKYKVMNESLSVKNENDDKFISNDFSERKIQAEDEIKKLISANFSDMLLNNDFKDDPVMVEKMKAFVNQSINRLGYRFADTHSKYKFINDFITNLTGFGILQPLMDDPAITEIYVISYDKIFYRRKGKKILSDIKFRNKEAVKNYIDAILAPLGRRVDNMNPMEDARLKNGDRVAISGDAISPQGFSFNIRKFSREKIKMDDLIDYNTINIRMAKMLEMFVKLGLNMLVSGGTSTGKTTLLNAMADYIRDDQMIATIEDNIELQLNKDMWLQLEARIPNIEGKGEVTLQQGLKHFMRRSPDIIIVGEIRDGKVGQTYLQAANTGHVAYATIHSNSPELCRQRICNLIMGAEGTPLEAVLDDFNKAVDIVLQIEKFSDINRIVLLNITYVENDGQLIDLCRFDMKLNDWVFIDEYPASLLDKMGKYSFMETSYDRD